MVQLHRHAQSFIDLNISVIIVGPESSASFKPYWDKLGLSQVGMPFIGIPDAKHEVLDLYAQPIRLLQLGRMPAQVLVDMRGVLRWCYSGSSMLDIPRVSEVLEQCRRVQE